MENHPHRMAERYLKQLVRARRQMRENQWPSSACMQVHQE
jgi:hypothetical protein